MFDVVILVGPKDKDIIKLQLPFTIKNIIGYRNIYIITPFVEDIQREIGPICKKLKTNVSVIHECIFPFSLKTVEKYHGKNNRNGWYLQQLIKLYAFLIPYILERYLIIDCDTFFMKPTQFLYDNNGFIQCNYNYGDEYHPPYFSHMSALHPFLQRRTCVSGICHHMMFETRIIKEIIQLVEKTNKDDNLPFWCLFLKKVEPSHFLMSGASEYEIYFHYVFKFYPERIRIRKLAWKNSNFFDDLQPLEKHKGVNNSLDYVSIHWSGRGCN